MPIDSIDAIKRRIIRNASKIWGFQDTQDINSFDPVLSLIIGALAEELHSISNEINKSDGRIVEKLLELLFNQNIYTHFPSHAIACARPSQACVEINDSYQFYIEKSVSGKKEGTVEKKSIYFTPTTSCTLFNSEIKFLCSGKLFFEIDGAYKEVLSELPAGKRPDYSNIILGIKTAPLTEVLDGISLFFSFKNLQTEERFYHLLHSAECKINGQKVEFSKGQQNAKPHQQNSLVELIKKDSNISYKTANYINDFYCNKFITLDYNNYKKKDFTNTKNLPNIITELADTSQANILNDDIIWLEIKLTQPISNEDISDLSVSLNCFPVVNRELNENSYSIYQGTNVIPLTSDDLFFDTKKITDSNDKEYTPSSSVNNSNKDTYHLRQGGIARFDSRDAQETITNLISLVRDEATAFSANGTDLISFELKELDQILSRLEQRTNSSDISNDTNSYIILKSKLKYDKVLVQYWSIVGDLANGIRPGTKMMVSHGLDLDSNRISLLTQSIGGKQKLSKDEKLNSLRRALLSKGRVVTIEDIKALCFEVFGTDLSKVDVKKGVSLNPLPGKGMTRTLDLHLLLNETTKLNNDDVWHKTESLKIRLKQDSVNLLPYRVFVK